MNKLRLFNVISISQLEISEAISLPKQLIVTV